MKMRKIWMGVASVLALVVSAYAIVQFVVFNPKSAGLVQLHLLDKEFPYTQWVNFLYLHAVGSAIALAVGPLLFSTRLQTKHLRLHRQLGKLYVLSIGVGGVSGIYLAFEALGGVMSQAGFLALDVVWLAATYLGYKRIRQKQVEQLREWMLRSYALTFAGVTLRFWLGLLGMLTIPVESLSQSDLLLGDFNRIYRIDAWLCWVPNLIAAEWLIRRRRKSGAQARFPLAD